MKKTFLAAAALAAVLATPAFAQTDGASGAGHRLGASHATGVGEMSSRNRTTHRRAVRRAPFDAYARSPELAAPSTGPFGGYRWPYVKYDAQGNMIGPNPIQPDRW